MHIHSNEILIAAIFYPYGNHDNITNQHEQKLHFKLRPNKNMKYKQHKRWDDKWFNSLKEVPVLLRKWPISTTFLMITCKKSGKQEFQRDSDSNALKIFATLNPDMAWPHRDIFSGIYGSFGKWHCGVEISALLVSRIRSSCNYDVIYLKLHVSAEIEMRWLLKKKKFCMCKYLEFVRPHLAAICHVTKRTLAAWQMEISVSL